jgi:hypothetical protein
MFRKGIRLEEITFGSYQRKAKGLKLSAEVEKDDGKYAFAKIVSSPVYGSFAELLFDIRQHITDNDIRLLHAPGKNYSESEREYRARKDEASYYSELAKRAEEKGALNIELNSLFPKELVGQTYRGSKFLFRRRGEMGMIYLAKAYLHFDDLPLLGVYAEIKGEYHAVSAINRKQGKKKKSA